MLKLVIWDLDGTLVNSLPSTYEAINEATFDFLGRQLSREEIRVHFGRGEHHILSNLVGRSNADASYERYLNATTNRLKNIQPFEGVLEELQKVQSAGLSCAIFTGRSRRATDIILRNLDLNSKFTAIITDDDVSQHKPHPEGIYKICKDLKISPSNAVMIGDTPLDILAGRTAGALTIGCTWDEMAYRHTLEEANAWQIATHPQELSGFLLNSH